MFLCANNNALVSAILACWQLGAVAALVDPNAPAPHRAAAIHQVAPHLIVTGPGLKAVTPEIRDSYPLVDIESHAEAASTIPPQTKVPFSGHGTAVILFTSGSTGLPKGVKLSFGAILESARLVSHYLKLGPKDVTSLFIPLTFRMALSVLMAHLFSGATIILEEGLVSTKGSVFERARHHGVTGVSCVPTHFRMMQDRGFFAESFTPRLRYVRVGAGKLRPAEISRFKNQRPGCELILTYGLTETGEVTLQTGEAALEASTSVGCPLADVAINIAPHDDAPYPAGEIAVSGKRLFSGYLTRDEGGVGSSETPFHTQDLGHLDGEGRLHLTGRLRAMVKVAGESISLHQIEQTLLTLPEIENAVAVAVQDQRLNEAPFAFVRVKTGHRFDAHRIRVHCRQHLSQQAMPRHIRSIRNFPTLTNSKLDRRALESRAAEICQESEDNLQPNDF